MPKIIIQSDAGEDVDVAFTLRERVVVGNLESDHYVAQLIERIRWAVADAETADQWVRSAQRRDHASSGSSAVSSAAPSSVSA